MRGLLLAIFSSGFDGFAAAGNPARAQRSVIKTTAKTTTKTV